MRSLRLLARAGVAVTTVAALAVPTLTFVYVRNQVQVGAQARGLPGPPSLSPAQERRYASLAGGSSPIVVLSYHDVIETDPAEPTAGEHRRAAGPEERSERGGEQTGSAPGGRRLSVTAADFAAHLRMLKLAGFSSPSAAEVADYVTNGAPLPSRSVLVTFDGARARDWTHADPILAEYGFRATVFIDPSIVDQVTGRSSLSWARLRAMVATGRWSVGILPSTLAEPVAVDATGRRESGLVARRWLPDHRRVETAAEFADRVRDGLAVATRKVVDAGLPAPTLLAYPFQPAYPLDRVDATFSELVTVVDSMFSVGLLTLSPDQAADPQWIGRRILPRLETYSTTTDEILFNRLLDVLDSR